MTDTRTHATPPAWTEGWYRFAHRCPSPNFGARPAHATIDLVVVHSISLPPGAFGNNHVQQLFCNQLDWQAHPYFQHIQGLEVSSHFFIQRGGELWQFVSCDARAWHAGVSQHQGRNNCNDFSIGIELEGVEGGAFEWAQYETLQALIAALAVHYPIHSVCGHEHVAPGRKNDPGTGFDWSWLQQSLDFPATYFPVRAHPPKTDEKPQR